MAANITPMIEHAPGYIPGAPIDANGKNEAGFASAMGESASESEFDRLADYIAERNHPAAVALIEIGKALIEAKEKLIKHGEFSKFLADKRVGYSNRVCQHLMKLAKQPDAEQLAGLGLGKMMELLILPPDERAALMRGNDFRSMTKSQTRAVVQNKKCGAEPGPTTGSIAVIEPSHIQERSPELDAVAPASETAGELPRATKAKCEQDDMQEVIITGDGERPRQHLNPDRLATATVADLTTELARLDALPPGDERNNNHAWWKAVFKEFKAKTEPSITQLAEVIKEEVKATLLKHIRDSGAAAL